MKKLLSYLAPAAVVLLASCSSEPSDWRPDKKVSLDLIAPGTRPSDNFDQGTSAAPNEAKGGAISEPVNSATVLDERAAPTPGGVMSADTQEGTAMKAGQSKKGTPKDSPAPDTAQGQAGARQ